MCMLICIVFWLGKMYANTETQSLFQFLIPNGVGCRQFYWKKKLNYVFLHCGLEILKLTRLSWSMFNFESIKKPVASQPLRQCKLYCVMALALTELVKNTYIANETEPILELVLEFVVWKKCTYLQMYLNKNRPFWEVNNIMLSP